VILLVIGLLVAFGGLRTLTVAQAYPRSLLAAGQYTGTDFSDDASDQATGDTSASDNQDSQPTLPRTELGSTLPASMAESAQQPALTSGSNASTGLQVPGQVEKAADVNRYVVVEGDTIEGIAAKFHVGPETVMGSNGIFDPEEELAPGRLLIVPPVD